MITAYRCKDPSPRPITVITTIIERNSVWFGLAGRLRTSSRTFFTSQVTRFAFSRGETGHGDGKLTDNVAWHWLPDSNDGCTRGAPRHGLSFTMYAKVANLSEPSGTLWRHTLFALFAWALCVVGAVVLPVDKTLHWICSNETSRFFCVSSIPSGHLEFIRNE